MSTISPVIDTVDGTRIMSAVWTPMGDGDTGAPMDYPDTDWDEAATRAVYEAWLAAK